MQHWNHTSLQVSRSLPTSSLSQTSRPAVVGFRADLYAPSNKFNIVDTYVIPKYKYHNFPGRITHFEVFSHL